MAILNSMSINMKRSVSYVEEYSVLSMDVTYVAVEVTTSFACIAILVAACMILLVGVAGPGGAFGRVGLSQAAQRARLFLKRVLVNGGMILNGNCAKNFEESVLEATRYLCSAKIL